MPQPVKMFPSRRQRQPAWLIESRAALRDTVVLLREFRRPLVTFFLVFFTGGGLYHLLAANAGEPVGSLAEATFPRPSSSSRTGCTNACGGTGRCQGAKRRTTYSTRLSGLSASFLRRPEASHSPPARESL